MKSSFCLVWRFGMSLLVAGLVTPQPAWARQNPFEDLIGSADQRLGSKKRQTLEAQVKAKPEDPASWLALAEYSYEHDQPDGTVVILKQALEKHPKNAPLWRLLAQVHLMDARSGPKWVQRPGVSRGRVPKSDLGEKEFREKAYVAALDALDHATKIAPGNLEVADRRVHVFFGLERWKEAEAALTAILQTRPTGDLAAMRGYALLKMDQREEAKKYIDYALGRDRGCASLHYVCARILEAMGDADGAKTELEQGKFYERLLPGSHLQYTPELGASLKRMFGAKEGTSGMFSGDRLNEQIGAEIEALAARKDEASSELLASLAWSHFAHGELEDRAFAVLGERGEIPLLVRIFDHAQAPCTMGGCLRQLVKLRAEGTYEKLSALLPKDGGMFPIGVVGLIVQFNDPRSAQLLISYTESKEAPFFEDGLVALGYFDSPATRKHLEKWTADEDARPFAAVALYRLAKDTKWVKPVEAFVNTAGLYELWSIEDCLGGIDTLDAKRMLETCKIRRESETKKKAERKVEPQAKE